MLTSGLGCMSVFLRKLFPPINNVLHKEQNWNLKEFWYLGECRVGKRWNYLRDHTACKSITLAILNILNALVRWISPRGNKRAKWSLGHLNSHHVRYFNCHKIPSTPLASCRAKITSSREAWEDKSCSSCARTSLLQRIVLGWGQDEFLSPLFYFFKYEEQHLFLFYFFFFFFSFPKGLGIKDLVGYFLRGSR